MPANPPLTASGSRDPDRQRPRPIPKQVRDMIVLMVRGQGSDPNARPVDFITAAQACGIKPNIARRWLDRSAVRQFLLAERRTFRDAICAGNEASLKRIRDTSPNAMAQLGAVRVLENIADADPVAPGGVARTPGFAILIAPAPGLDVRPAPIDVTPARQELDPADE